MTSIPSNIINIQSRLGKPTKPKPKIGVIIQARMTSKRFPGKSMAPLAGKPVIQHVMERALKIRGPQQYHKPWVVLAVPDEPESEVMLALADKLKVGNYLGESEDVLARYYSCARFFGVDVIMRLTGDCPFINPRVCSECLQLLCWRNLDYVSNIYPERTYQKGLDCEVFTMDCLEAAYKLATTDYEREHVTPWMQKETEVTKSNVKQKENKSEVNWCVDYPDDIERLEKELGYINEQTLEDKAD